jgi:hypothetical protein
VAGNVDQSAGELMGDAVAPFGSSNQTVAFFVDPRRQI